MMMLLLLLPATHSFLATPRTPAGPKLIPLLCYVWPTPLTPPCCLPCLAGCCLLLFVAHVSATRPAFRGQRAQFFESTVAVWLQLMLPRTSSMAMARATASRSPLLIALGSFPCCWTAMRQQQQHLHSGHFPAFTRLRHLLTFPSVFESLARSSMSSPSPPTLCIPTSPLL